MGNGRLEGSTSPRNNRVASREMLEVSSLVCAQACSLVHKGQGHRDRGSHFPGISEGDHLRANESHLGLSKLPWRSSAGPDYH